MPAEGIGSMARGATDVVVITGGDAVERAHTDDIPPGALVIAADSGLDHARALGLAVDVAVGDFDSASPLAFDQAIDGGVTIERHPAAKDATDLQLALDAALARGATRIHVLGGHGGRLDHLLANILLLGRPAYASAAVTAQMGSARITIVRQQATVRGPVGSLVSLVPLHGTAEGITTTGLRYPLAGEDLHAASTRGVSNELVHDVASVALTGGVLAVIQPGRGAP
jgi:thiamine pyrophosphokinase